MYNSNTKSAEALMPSQGAAIPMPDMHTSKAVLLGNSILRLREIEESLDRLLAFMRDGAGAVYTNQSVAATDLNVPPRPEFSVLSILNDGPDEIHSYIDRNLKLIACIKEELS